jgi:hypothetical protein
VFQGPAGLQGVEVREFLSWIRGSNDGLVNECMRAAMIRSDAKLGELSDFQRAALIGVLRFRRRIER